MQFTIQLPGWIALVAPLRNTSSVAPLAVDDIHEVVHDHVVQARGDRLVLRFGQDPEQEVAGLGGQPRAVILRGTNSRLLSRWCRRKRRDAFRAMLLTSAPRHHRRAPAG